MNNQLPPVDQYRLGPLIIHGRENRIDTPDGTVTVLPKVMILLLYLCRHTQKVVTFDELNQAVWPKEVVGDNAIYNLVGQLRKALGDKASQPIYIQTISKQGYRLLIEAEPVAVEKHSAPPKNQNSAPSSEVACFTRPNNWQLFVYLLVMATALLVWLPHSEAPDPEAERMLKLARYQLYRGDDTGLERAIETLQQTIAIAPTWSVSKTELAYAFLRRARQDSDGRDFWLEKAQSLSEDNSLEDAGERLSAIITALASESGVDELERLFADEEIQPSARLAYAQLLFDRGQSEQSLAQELKALKACADCPYVYRRVATSQMVSGHVQESFASFTRYRQLTDRNSQSPADNTGMVALNKQTLKAMATWYAQHPATCSLQPHQRNALALFFLTLGDTDAAEQLLNLQKANQTQSPSHFDLYTRAAIAGAKGQYEKSLQYLQQRQEAFPENTRFKRSVVYALWLLGREAEALDTFRRYQILPHSDSLPANMPFEIGTLYAGLLIKTGQPDLGNEILRAMETRLRAGWVSGSHHADIRLAAVLALQDKHEAAIEALRTALLQGWVSDFNQSWWTLLDSPFFRSIKDISAFQTLVRQYQLGIDELKVSIQSMQ